MTGQKDRYTTTEKLWKLDDETLTTPKHDEIVIWLLNPNNVLSIYGFDTTTRFKTEIEFYIKNPNNDRDIHIPNVLNDNKLVGCFYGVKDIHTLYNFPKFMMDKIDIIKTEFGEAAMKSHFDQNIKDGMNILSEVPLFGGNKFIVGYVDIIVHFEDVINEHGHFKYIHKYGNVQTKYIEVKTNIKSFGQTLRQLRTYESFLPENKNKPQHKKTMIDLVTPDNTFKKAFESQGIKVLTYPE